jgi:hypothetical protein
VNESGKFLDPLNAICSKKWAMPLFFAFSYLEPAPTRSIVVRLGKEFVSMRQTFKPFFKVVSTGFMTISIHVQN